MKCYYSDSSVTLFHGPMEEVLPALGLFDACITDPPYGDTSLAWDRWPQGWPALVAAHCPVLWCWGSMRMFLQHAREFDSWKFSQDVVWQKQNGTGLHNDRSRRVHEAAVMFYRGEWKNVFKCPPIVSVDEEFKRIQRSGKPQHWGGMSRVGYDYAGKRLALSVIQAANCHRAAVHPTQKPEAVITPLMDYSVPAGGAVLYPFSGGGTTLLVAKLSGRKAVGIEASEAYCEAAARRLQEVFALGI